MEPFPFSYFYAFLGFFGSPICGALQIGFPPNNEEALIHAFM
jgi:hypothetical protein